VAVDLRCYTPRQFADLVVEKLAELGYQFVTATGRGRQDAAGGMGVSRVDPRRLGDVAITAPGVPDEVLPEYVPQIFDAAEHGVRAKVAAAAERGGFVLLVSGSLEGPPVVGRSYGQPST